MRQLGRLGCASREHATGIREFGLFCLAGKCLTENCLTRCIQLDTRRVASTTNRCERFAGGRRPLSRHVMTLSAYSQRR